MGDDGDLADLRRRVYGPDPTDEDRQRYAAAVAAAATAGGASVGATAATTATATVAAGTPGAEPALAGRPRGRRRRVALAATIAVAVIATVAVVVATRPPALVGAPPEALPVGADDRAAFVDALVIGTDAGIAAYLLTHGAPHELDGVTSVDTVEERGVGPGDVALLHGAASAEVGVVVDARTGQTLVPAAGRVTVLLVVAQSADVGWALTQGGARRVTARRAGEQAAGSLTSATIRYAVGGRPDRVQVDVPAGIPWGVAAVYTN